MKIGDYLNGQAIPPQGELRQKIIDLTMINDEPSRRTATVKFLCKEFSMSCLMPRDVRTGNFVCGLFYDDQMLPEHMWIVKNGMIYDTMPGAPIRRNINNNKLNPPSETNLVAQQNLAFAEVALFSRSQTAIINSTAWV